MNNSKILVSLVFFALSASLAQAGNGRENSTATGESAALARQLAERMEEINATQRDLLDRMQAMEEQRRELELMMRRVDNLDEYRGGTDPSDGVKEVQIVGTEQKMEREAQIEESAPELPRVSSSVGGVLTPKGRLVVEPSIQFLHSSVNRVSVEGFTILPALLIGVIDIVEIDQNSYIGGLTARYGLTDRLEVDIKGTYLSRDETTRTREVLRDQDFDSGSLTAVETSRNADGSDIGDIEMGLRYQFNRGGKWPFLVGNLRVKSDTGTDPFELATKSLLDDSPEFSGELPTGSGFWSVNPSLTFIYPTDPVVFFGNVGYLWTIEDDKDKPTDDEGNIIGFGKVDPGDAWRFNFGMGLGLNDRSSISISYALDLFNRTTIETASPMQISGSDVTVGRLLIGYSLKLPGGSPLNLAVGIGATEDAPDTDITFRLPFNYLN